MSIRRCCTSFWISSRIPPIVIVLALPCAADVDRTRKIAMPERTRRPATQHMNAHTGIRAVRNT